MKKTLKIIHGVRLDNRRVILEQSSRTKYFMYLFLMSLNKSKRIKHTFLLAVSLIVKNQNSLVKTGNCVQNKLYATQAYC